MGKRSKYQSAPVGSDDLQQALEWIEEGISGVSLNVRLVRPKQGNPYLYAVASGYRRSVRIGQKARVVAESRYPSNQYGSLLACLYSLLYTLAERAEYEPVEVNGQYTDLFPGWKPKR